MKTSYAESPRFPAQRQSAQGESAPKARLRSVVDGKQVNIPAPTVIAMGGRRRLDQPADGVRFKPVGGSLRQIREINAER